MSNPHDRYPLALDNASSPRVYPDRHGRPNALRRLEAEHDLRKIELDIDLLFRQIGAMQSASMIRRFQGKIAELDAQATTLFAALRPVLVGDTLVGPDGSTAVQTYLAACRRCQAEIPAGRFQYQYSGFCRDCFTFLSTPRTPESEAT